MKNIPKQEIAWIVGRLHVSKTDDEVRAEIRRRAGTDPQWTSALLKRACDYAVKCHKANVRLYVRVMSGRF